MLVPSVKVVGCLDSLVIHALHTCTSQPVI